MSEPREGDLAASFRRLIAATGPISLAHYMGEANARYYSSRNPLGAAGDFITAPEISQMFGELIGLWLADMWQRAGSPAAAHYVELGPGRGTLARDALRAMKQAGLTPQVHFVEGSDSLRHAQRIAVPGATWHHDLSTVPTDGPILLAANEFLDALPIRQLLKTKDGWRELVVVPDGDKFACAAGDRPMDAALPDDRRDAPEDTLIEVNTAATSVVREAAERLAVQGGAALFIDYGYAVPQAGSTLQAVRAHAKVDPFTDPGEADLTAHVDFAVLAEVAQASGASWQGTVTQGEFLTRLGIAARAASLARSAPDQTAALQQAVQRLVSDGEMGTLFKVMALAAPTWPDGAGF